MFISGISGGTQSLGGIGHKSSNFVKAPVPFSFALVGGGGGAGNTVFKFNTSGTYTF